MVFLTDLSLIPFDEFVIALILLLATVTHLARVSLGLPFLSVVISSVFSVTSPKPPVRLGDKPGLNLLVYDGIYRFPSDA